jgi:hypothetical protein
VPVSRAGRIPACGLTPTIWRYVRSFRISLMA